MDKSSVIDQLPSLKGKTLADVEALRRETVEMKYKSTGNQQIEARLRALQQLADAQQQVAAGLYGQAFSYCTNANRYGGMEAQQDMLPLTMELLMTFLPQYLEIERRIRPRPTTRLWLTSSG